ncbi:hypothetical protein [Actinomadura rugatobispora]|uniref:Uncharacterized protein n=1 Tax=Actinomadura rugatobispora TaxID=1994 RepID=A0ABW1A7W5_9ACTN|nr:hypothetical protein GCM10010200_017830 [Actinomadura rugatobispora]
MADERTLQLLVIATIVRKSDGTKKTHEFLIDGDGYSGPEAIHAAVSELEKLRGGPVRETEWLSFLNVHPNELEGTKHAVVISVDAKDRRHYHDSLQLEGYKTRQELLGAALEQLPAAAREGAVECLCVNPTELDTSD